MAERISIEALKPGMVIVKVIEQNGPVRIRKSGLVSSDAMVTGLREMGVLELEIDPDQTVEIHADGSPQSQTQFLLQSNTSNQESNIAATQQDSQLAEQFNRSLFLPTAQDIPDTWQIYAKKAVTGLGVVIVGFGLGFGSAFLTKDAPIEQVASLSEQDSNSSPAEQAQQDVEDTLATITDNETKQAVINAPESLAQDLAAKAETLSNDAQNTVLDENQTGEMLVLGAQPEQPIDLDTGNFVGADTADIEQDPNVSKDLLKKFQQVMVDMEAQGEDLDIALATAEALEPKNVPRIDQMPEWVLSSLPKMSFNAHMFASEPADRWVKVNGKELGEGDWIDGQLRIERIEQQHVILNFQGHEFNMRALSEW